jgi:uncharacterized protein (TIGR03437 family)
MGRVRRLSLRQFPLLFACAYALGAQTLQINPNPLLLTAQPNTGASATVMLTSSGSALGVVAAPNPGTMWLHVSPLSQQVTPASLTVSTDPMAAGTYPSFITISTQGSVVNLPVTLNVSVAGVAPTSLNFQYVVGGAVPPAQSIAVTLPPSTTATVSRSTDNGGNWLDFAVSGNPLNTITAQIDGPVAATLTPGTYTGTIIVTPSGSNATAATVRVTLVVSALPQITVAPTSLAFNYQVGGSNNQTQQTIQLSAGPQAIPFLFTSDSWISASPPSGTVAANSSMTVTVGITPPSQTPNTYNGTITLTTSSSQKIPVALTVSNNPLLNVPAAPIALTYQIGGNVPLVSMVTPTSTGGIIQYALSSNASWLQVPATAVTPNAVMITVDPTSLAPGSYTGMVQFAAPGNAAQSITVTLAVTNNTVAIPSVNSLTFVYQTGQQQPAAQTVSMTTTSGLPVNYSATPSTSWMTLVGHASGTTPDSFTVSVNPAGVPTGVNTGQISVAVTNAATGASQGTVTIGVTLYVSNSALLVVNPSQPVLLTAQAPSSQAITQNVMLTSTNTDVLSLAVGQPQTASGGNWLVVFSSAAATPGNLRLAALTNDLGPGVYTGSVTVTATGPGGVVLDSPYTIPVILNMTTGPISANVTTLSFTQNAGGAAPATQSVSLTSALSQTDFFITTYDGGLGWLSATVTQGRMSGTATVAVNGSGLTPGTYQGRVIVGQNLASGSPLIIPVTLQVTAGAISAPTTPLVFTAPLGSTATLTANVAVSGTPGALSFSVATSTNNSGAWLTATPASGTTPSTVQVAVNPSGLAVNTYSGSVTITSAGVGGSPITIPVTLNVVAPQTLTVTPATLPAFTYTLGQAVPSGQTLQVQAGGTATPFTVTTQTASGGNTWLQVTPTSGTTPASITVTVNPSALAPGTYQGTVLIGSSSALAPSPVQVTLNVVQTAKPVITSIQNGASYFLGAVSPGENIYMKGTGLGPATLTMGQLGQNGLVATTLASTQVMFDNVAAPIIYASATQTSVMVPYEVFGRPQTTVTVTYQGVASDPVVYNVAPVAPGIYTLNQMGSGQGSVFNQDGITVNGPNTPAAKGSVIALYLTGEGPTAPQGVDGAIAPSDGSLLKHPLATVTATIGGIPATVFYAGSAPGIVNGIAQINVQIPANAPSGPNVPIVLIFTTSGYAAGTQPGVTVAVQ